MSRLSSEYQGHQEGRKRKRQAMGDSRSAEEDMRGVGNNEAIKESQGGNQKPEAPGEAARAPHDEANLLCGDARSSNDRGYASCGMILTATRRGDVSGDDGVPSEGLGSRVCCMRWQTGVEPLGDKALEELDVPL